VEEDTAGRIVPKARLPDEVTSCEDFPKTASSPPGDETMGVVSPFWVAFSMYLYVAAIRKSW
jgi:hypothetical protein